MSFRFKSASCVVAGTFNMYIIQPSWLTRIGAYPKGTKFLFSAKLDEPGNRFEPQGAPHKWTVSPTRIDLESTRHDDDCGEKIGLVLERLPETPLKAVGCNFNFESPWQDFDDVKGWFGSEPKFPDIYEVAQRTVHFGLSRAEHLFNLQLSIANEVMDLSINVHTVVVDKPSGFAIEVVNRFLNLRDESEGLIRKVFNLEVDYGENNQELDEESNGRNRRSDER